MKIERKITKIEIKNYRAFYGEHKIDLPNGENLLIYGENGSGKSSLYGALQTFFSHTEILQDYQETQGKGFSQFLNRFIDNDSPKEGFIKISFDNEEPLEYGTEKKTNQQKFIKDTHNLNSFINYKVLQEIHRTDFKKKEVDFFDLMVSHLLNYVENPVSGKQFGFEWLDLSRLVTKDKRTKEFKALNGQLELFNDGLSLVILEIQNLANEFLTKYFNHNIHVELKPELVNIRGNKLRNCHIFPKISYFGIPKLEKYEEFLNEARLSALAISIFFAAILKTPQENVEYKLLVLDDIFVGLDTSNRIPVLDILKEYFSEYQIFIMTYDRAWFEFSKDWSKLKQNEIWKFSEFYVNDFTNEFDIPVIEKSDSLMSKALYYELKFDYSASANYLRKAVEKFLKDKFKGLILKGNDGMDLEGLDRQIRAVIRFLDNIEMDCSKFQAIAIYTQSLMNPLSHYDFSVPVFKKELFDIRNILIELQDFHNFTNTKILVEKEKELLLKIQVNQDTTNFYTFELKENIFICKIGNQKHFTDSEISSLKCWETINEINEDEQDFRRYQNTTFKKVVKDIISYENKKNTKLNLQIPDWKIVFYFDNRTLQELADATNF